ncbi:putative signal transducing protein [Desulforhopalus sp. 52FAK]
MSKFKTVISYFDLPLAELAKAKLESEGIPCFLLNKHHVGMNWMYSNALGGVKVQVHTENFERAMDILTTDESAILSEIDQEFPEVEKNDICRKCGSANLSYINLSRKAGALFLLLSLPLFLFGIRYKCKDCGHKMKPMQKS